MIDILKANIEGEATIVIDPYKKGENVEIKVKYDALYEASSDLTCDCNESTIWKMEITRNGEPLTEFSRFLEEYVYPGHLLPKEGETEEEALVYAIEEAISTYADEEYYKRVFLEEGEEDE